VRLQGNKLKRKSRSIAIIGTLVASILFGMINLETTPPLWLDEGWILTVARNWLERAHYGLLLAGEPVSTNMTTGFPAVGPIALSFKFFGVGIWQGRIVGVFFGIGALSLLCYIAFRLYGWAVAVATIAVLMLMSMHEELHPVLISRQALGEMPALFYLLGGYACFLSASTKSSCFVPLSIFFWSIALITKLQVLPFWALSLLIPLALLLLTKSWTQSGLIASMLIGAIITSRALLWFLQSLVQYPTLSAPDGLYNITALVWALSPRLVSLMVTLLFGVPTLLGLFYGAWSFTTTKAKFLSQDHTEVVKLALLVLASSWFGWYAALSVGWIRYLFPATFIGSIFVAAMLYSLTGHFNAHYTIDRAGSVITHLNITRQNIASLLTVLLITISLAATLRMLYQSYVIKPDGSVLQVAEFLNTQIPRNALIETYDSELFFLLKRRYHYPPDEIHIKLNKRTFLRQPVSINYDPLANNPDYLVVGPHSRLWHLYDPIVKTGAFRLLKSYGRYEVYERLH